MTIREEKSAFRRSIKSLISSQSSSQLSSQQEKAVQQLLESDLYKKSTTILAYVAQKNEFSLLQSSNDCDIINRKADITLHEDVPRTR